MRFVVGGVEPKLVMAGVRQIWPKVLNRDVTTLFAEESDYVRLPYQGFDGRTESGSRLMRSSMSENGLLPQQNFAATYEFRALDQAFNSAWVSVETLIPQGIKTLALPSMLIIAVTVNADKSIELIGAEYGSDGVRIISLLNNQIRYEYFVAYGLFPGSTLKVQRFMSFIEVFVDGLRVGAATHSTFTLVGRPGVGVYSSMAPNLSTPIGKTTILGGGSIPKTYGGMLACTVGVRLGALGWFPLATLSVEGGRSMRAVVRNLAWEVANSGRIHQVNAPGKTITIGNSNGVDNVTTEPFDVPANGTVTLMVVMNTANIPDTARVLKSGSIELIPA